MKNRCDEQGWPVCPACDEPIAPDESTGHLDRYMLHLHCWLVTDDLGVARPAQAGEESQSPTA
jgi:hypothetical protein